MANTQRHPDQRRSLRPTAGGLILAAHGSHHDAEVNEAIRSIAAAAQKAAISQGAVFDEVVACFHQGTPSFSDVLDQITADDVTVVPLMTSEGYFSGEVLPSALRRNHRFDDVAMTITPVLGTHDAIPKIIARRVQGLCLEHHIHPAEAIVVVVGHGTRRNPRSRAQTIDTAKAVDQLGPWTQTVYAFIDDDPAVNTAIKRCGRGSIIVTPFLISAGPHAMGLPQELRLDPSDCVELPFVRRHAEGIVIVDEPLLRYPALPGLIVELARATANRRGAAPR